MVQLELQDVITAHSTQCLTCAHLLPGAYIHGTQIAIHRDLAAMAHHNHSGTTKTEHTTHHTIVDGTSLATW